MLLVCPECPQRDVVAKQLLEQCERFLIDEGATTTQGGAAPPLAPFYAGLYGGSLPPGVLAEDEFTQFVFADSGYQVAGRTSICRRSLEGFRPLVDRQMMQVRRQTQMSTLVDPPTRDWWEAMEIGEFDLTRFELSPKRASGSIATLTVRDMGPPSPDLPGPTAGILDLFVAEANRRQGTASFLLGEAFKQLKQQGIGSVEAHIPADDRACAALCRKLGLEVAAEAVQFRKDVG